MSGLARAWLYEPVFPEGVQRRLHLGVHFGIGAGGITKLFDNPGFVAFEMDGGLACEIEEDGAVPRTSPSALFLTEYPAYAPNSYPWVTATSDAAQ